MSGAEAKVRELDKWIKACRSLLSGPWGNVEASLESLVSMEKRVELLLKEKACLERGLVNATKQ